MKIWLTKDTGGDLLLHTYRPMLNRMNPGTFFSLSNTWIFRKEERALKKLLNFTDWPKPGQVLEWDTDKDYGWLYDGSEL